MISYKEITALLLANGVTGQQGLCSTTIYPQSWHEPSEVNQDCIDEFIEQYFGGEFFVLAGEFVYIGDVETSFLYSYNDDLKPNDNDKIILSSGEDEYENCEYIYLYPIVE